MSEVDINRTLLNQNTGSVKLVTEYENNFNNYKNFIYDTNKDSYFVYFEIDVENLKILDFNSINSFVIELNEYTESVLKTKNFIFEHDNDNEKLISNELYVISFEKNKISLSIDSDYINIDIYGLDVILTLIHEHFGIKLCNYVLSVKSEIILKYNKDFEGSYGVLVFKNKLQVDYYLFDNYILIKYVLLDGKLKLIHLETNLKNAYDSCNTCLNYINKLLK